LKNKVLKAKTVKMEGNAKDGLTLSAQQQHRL